MSEYIIGILPLKLYNSRNLVCDWQPAKLCAVYFRHEGESILNISRVLQHSLVNPNMKTYRLFILRFLNPSASIPFQGSTALVGLGLLIFQVSASHQTHHTWQESSGWVISPSQRPLPNSTKHSQETDTHAPGGIRTRNPNKWEAADPRLRPPLGLVHQFNRKISRHINEKLIITPEVMASCNLVDMYHGFGASVLTWRR
jgi:hypothetical protein